MREVVLVSSSGDNNTCSLRPLCAPWRERGREREGGGGRQTDRGRETDRQRQIQIEREALFYRIK